MALTRDGATIQESLQFVDARTALLTIDNPSKRQLVFGADSVSRKMQLSVENGTVLIACHGGERVMLTFPEPVRVAKAATTTWPPCLRAWPISPPPSAS